MGSKRQILLQKKALLEIPASLFNRNEVSMTAKNRYKRKCPFNSQRPSRRSGERDLPMVRARAWIISGRESSATACFLRKPPQLLDILTQALEVSLIVGTLHEPHLMRQEIPLVGPLGVQPLPVVEFPGAVVGVVVVVAAMSVLVGGRSRRRWRVGNVPLQCDRRGLGWWGW